ncbi:MAG: diphosphomevalonate decarboxylase [bacterium]
MSIKVKSPANIAFVKYWGRADHQLFVARNTSISMNISGCCTTIEADLHDGDEDIIEVKFYNQEPKRLYPDDHKSKEIFKQIERIRKESGIDKRVKMFSENNFPADAGIASSASALSAITAALLNLYGMKDKFEDKIEFSRQIRLCGSGSAIRSAMDGFVEFLAPDHDTDVVYPKPDSVSDETKKVWHEQSHSRQIADEKSWDLVDVVAIVNPEKKLVSSSQGHLMADSSPYYEARIAEIGDRIKKVRQAILDKDIRTLGPLIEQDSTSMHSVMMTSNPAIFYWSPGSMRIMLELMKWRREDDLQAYFTLDAGPNVHVICEKKDAAEVTKRLEALPEVQWTIYNEACKGAEIIS